MRVRFRVTMVMARRLFMIPVELFSCPEGEGQPGSGVVDNAVFDELVLSGSMFTAHMPGSYLQACEAIHEVVIHEGG